MQTPHYVIELLTPGLLAHRLSPPFYVAIDPTSAEALESYICLTSDLISGTTYPCKALD